MISKVANNKTNLLTKQKNYAFYGGSEGEIEDKYLASLLLFKYFFKRREIYILE